MGSETQENISMERSKQEEEGMAEPVSPTGQYFNSSVLSICVLGVLESEVPIDDSPTMSLLQDVFLPINPRFSSIMISDRKGEKQWKRVDVNLKNHVNVPTFPAGLSPKSYENYFNGYLSKIALEPLPQTQPLWEMHIIKYPTSNAAGNLIFKLHHALGDGFSLMGALLSCLQRVENPSIPLTFPPLQLRSKPEIFKSKKSTVSETFSSIFNTMSDFGWSLLKSSVVEDVQSPVRSGDDGVEFKPITISTMTFSLDQIKQIKTRLGVTINDVITGIIFYGIRLYMLAVSNNSTNAHSTALVLLNTRIIGSYKSATAKYIHSTLKNSSMTISNVIGPVERMALANHPVKGLYFMVVGVPQSLTITMVSYTGKLRIAVGTEKDFIDPQKFKSCIENAFEMIFKSSCEALSRAN
ncbi:hypothetical protein GH714_043590 [Hevea brasiliensis]|uniref:Uncharacterized protein n=1 Tax=Hevea brasiliensis TaxID=3981 RepID=A0A6A6K4X7_HEVBR|nr:hypothetical protein GH714_043590 [Hevea brasiliensis]